MPTINILYKVPAANALEVEDVLKAHAEHMKASYPADKSKRRQSLGCLLY
jgi:hypothetical protein